jgi:hypothetical protein
MSFFDAHSFEVSNVSHVLRLNECTANQTIKGAVEIESDFVLPSPVNFSKFGNVTQLSWDGELQVALQHADYPLKLHTLCTFFKLHHHDPEANHLLRALPPNLTYLETNRLEFFDMQSTSLTSLNLTYGNATVAFDAALCPNLSHLQILCAAAKLREQIRAGVLRTFTQLQSLNVVSDRSELPETLCGNLPPNLRKLELSHVYAHRPNNTFCQITTDMLPLNLRELVVQFVVDPECSYMLPHKLETFSCVNFTCVNFNAGVFPESLTSCTFQTSDFLCIANSQILPVGLRHLQFNGAFQTREVASRYNLLTSLVYLNVHRTFQFSLYIPPNVQQLAISSHMLSVLRAKRVFNSILDLKITGTLIGSETLQKLGCFPMITSLDLPTLSVRWKYKPSPRPLITTLRINDAPHLIPLMTPNVQKLVVVNTVSGYGRLCAQLPSTITTVEIHCGWHFGEDFQQITEFVQNTILPLPGLATLVLQGPFVEEWVSQICELISARGFYFYAVLNKKTYTHSIHFIK